MLNDRSHITLVCVCERGDGVGDGDGNGDWWWWPYTRVLGEYDLHVGVAASPDSENRTSAWLSQLVLSCTQRHSVLLALMKRKPPISFCQDFLNFYPVLVRGSVHGTVPYVPHSPPHSITPSNTSNIVVSVQLTRARYIDNQHGEKHGCRTSNVTYFSSRISCHNGPDDGN